MRQLSFHPRVRWEDRIVVTEHRGVVAYHHDQSHDFLPTDLCRLRQGGFNSNYELLPFIQDMDLFVFPSPLIRSPPPSLFHIWFASELDLGLRFSPRSLTLFIQIYSCSSCGFGFLLTFLVCHSCYFPPKIHFPQSVPLWFSSLSVPLFYNKVMWRGWANEGSEISAGVCCYL